MKNLFVPAFSVLFSVVIVVVALDRVDVPNAASVNKCIGECYDAYVAANGNILEQQIAAAEAAASASPAELGKTAYVGCTACHGAGGEGGIGPQLRGRDSAFVVTALTAYKNREERGAQSAVMFPSAAALSAADIENIAAFVETL